MGSELQFQEPKRPHQPFLLALPRPTSIEHSLKAVNPEALSKPNTPKSYIHPTPVEQSLDTVLSLQNPKTPEPRDSEAFPKPNTSKSPGLP